LKNRRKKLWIILVVSTFLLIGGYQVISRLYVEDSKRIRIQLRETIKQKYPGEANETLSGYGMKPAEEEDVEERKNARRSDVILIHGMDDPGKV
jgi:flagellar basal body-associated protein FliL